MESGQTLRFESRVSGLAREIRLLLEVDRGCPASRSGDDVNLTNPEKLILTILCEVHQKLEIEGETNTKFIADAIYTGNTWALSWSLDHVLGDMREPTPPAVLEVAAILGMWSALEQAFEDFEHDGKAKVRAGITHQSDICFHGFDGNSETEQLSIASFLVNKMGRFEKFSGRDLNSHCPSMQGHTQMLDKYRRINPSATAPLTPEQVIEIVLGGRG